MSQQAAVTLNSIVYNPAAQSNGVLYWYDRSGGYATSFSPLTQTFVTNSGDLKRTKFTVRLEIPSVATVDSAYAQAGDVLSTCSFQGQFWMDGVASATERADLLARVIDLIGSTVVSDAVKDLDPNYA